MATLNIDGQRVKVDDSFLSLSPEEQESAVNEIAGSLKGQALSTQSQPKPTAPKDSKPLSNSPDDGWLSSAAKSVAEE